MIGIVVAAHSSLSQLFQFGISMNTMILCAGVVIAVIGIIEVWV